MSNECEHDWVGSGERLNTLVPLFTVVCTKCRSQDSRRFGSGRPRIAWLEYWRLLGLDPPHLGGRDMTRSDGPAIHDRGT